MSIERGSRSSRDKRPLHRLKGGKDVRNRTKTSAWNMLPRALLWLCPRGVYHLWELRNLVYRMRETGIQESVGSKSMSKVPLKLCIRRPVFDWLLRSGGWTSKEISESLFSKRIEREGFLTAINKGDDIIIPLEKAEKLAELLQRPLSALFLSSPPYEPPLPKDFRG